LANASRPASPAWQWLRSRFLNPEQRHRLGPSACQSRSSSIWTETLRSSLLDQLGMSIGTRPRFQTSLDDPDGMLPIFIA
ncbi:hypothetical protein COCVIDRAFT_103568, partial [Bipolaris victoriae FI3]